MNDAHTAPTRLYHNPRCSKSRGALELERRVEQFVDLPPAFRRHASEAPPQTVEAPPR